MCALMGSSGGMFLFEIYFYIMICSALSPFVTIAGKTTLMDVIAMRKNSGSITGSIELNGHKQERVAFLRSSGYVEQFDVSQYH